MSAKKKLEQTVQRMEHHLECWKQFNDFVLLARAKKFTSEDESQFLEIKCVLTQELELLLASVESPCINRQEIHELLASAPSIRFLSERDDQSLVALENHWHKLFLSWQSLLGQLKVRKQELDSRSFLSSLFETKKKTIDK